MYRFYYDSLELYYVSGELSMSGSGNEIGMIYGRSRHYLNVMEEQPRLPTVAPLIPS